jgi:uncharacterized protein YbjT (DUF2867 family)
MLALTGTTGKLGGAILDAVLSHHLIPTSDLVVLTSSPFDTPKIAQLTDTGISVRQANYADGEAVRRALKDCESLSQH